MFYVKEESEKIDLKFNIQKSKIMASSSIMSWQIEGDKSGSSDNLDSIFKSRDIILPPNPYSQSYGFSSNNVFMWELNHKESWA